MKQLQIFLISLRWDATPLQGYSIEFASTDLYTWVERGIVKVKCLAQEHKVLVEVETSTRTA